MKTPESTNALSIAIRIAAKGKNVNAREIANNTGVAYDYTRRVVKGLNYPSRDLLQRLCGELDLDLEEMLHLYRLSKAFDIVNEVDRNKGEIDKESDPALES